MKALIVLAHPRGDSLTAQVASRVAARYPSVDLLDLHAEGFDPRMPVSDEPDWVNPDKHYSSLVYEHFSRVMSADVIIPVFPVWWFGLPAMLKGWIDRVWNYGLAYGRSTAALSGKRMLWIGLTGYSREVFVERGWDRLIDQQLRIGISEFVGISDASVHLLHGTEPPVDVQRIMDSLDVALNSRGSWAET